MTGLGGLTVVGLDLSPTAGIAQTHASNSEPRLSVQSVNAAGRPLHIQADTLQRAVMQACKVRPDVVVIEGTFSRPGGSDYQMHHIRACVTQWLFRQGIPYADVQPSTLKVWATGSGATRGENKVTKDKVCAGVVAMYGRFLHINPRDDDACDAVAALTLGLAAYGQPLTEVPDTHSRAIRAVTWPTLGGTQ
ncbi:hypothetical protein AB0M54_24490 [Actinoplanes sp. NPDC051470]|uniref:hypothetical protein n=1 Tax=Actinoplanes sp. NPDC051470 TaxID=3157224 RepID=UPI00344834C7